jgi:hypothetical protein
MTWLKIALNDLVPTLAAGCKQAMMMTAHDACSPIESEFCGVYVQTKHPQNH